MICSRELFPFFSFTGWAEKPKWWMGAPPAGQPLWVRSQFAYKQSSVLDFIESKHKKNWCDPVLGWFPPNLTQSFIPSVLDQYHRLQNSSGVFFESQMTSKWIVAALSVMWAERNKSGKRMANRLSRWNNNAYCGCMWSRVNPLLVWLFWATFFLTGNTGRLCGSDFYCVQCDGSCCVSRLAARLLLPPAVEPWQPV